jgi:hypothetical protein
VVDDFLRKASGLWAAQMANKLAVLCFSFLVGRELGAEGLGVMASVLAVTWVGGTIAGMGLSDRAMFRGAYGDLTVEHRRLYGVFLLSIVAVHLLIIWGVEWLSVTVDSQGTGFARGLVFGAGAQCMSSLGLSWLRGASRPRVEVVANILSAAVLVFGAMSGMGLGLSWACFGTTILGVSIWGNRFEGGLEPSFPGLSDLGKMVKSGSGYLLFGLGAWWLGNVDILLGRALFSAADIGALQVGTMVVRGLGLVPWVAATLMLYSCRLDWESGIAPRRWAWLAKGLGLGLLVAASSWMVVPLLARGHGIPVAVVEQPSHAVMLWAPVLYGLLFLLPLAAQWNLGGTLRAVGMGVMIQLGLGFMAVGRLDVAVVVSVAGVGQLVTLMWVLSTLGSKGQQRFDVHLSTSTPGVHPGGGPRT